MTTSNSTTDVDVTEACSRIVRFALREKNWPPARLAQELSVNIDLVRRWIRGERRIQVEDLVTIAKLGNISLDEHFGIDAKSSRPQEDWEAFADQIGASVVRRLGEHLLGHSEDPVQVDDTAAERKAGDGPLAGGAREAISERAGRVLDEVIAQDKPARSRKLA